MADKSVEKKHSETAVMAGLHRTIANKEFKNDRFGPDYLAEYFLPSHFRFFIRFDKIRKKIRNKLNTFMPGLFEYMIARTKYFDNVFTDALNKNVPQIVLLGAGYDTRAYRFAKLNNATKIFELDIVTTQNRKKKCLKKAQMDVPELVTLIPIDFNKESIKNVLEKAGYENNKKTLFIWEGVCYYLEPESIDATLEFVSASSQNESVLAFDYAVLIAEENMSNYYGVKEFAQTMKKHHPNEIFKFAIDESRIKSFLEERGLKMVNHMNAHEIEKSFLLDDKELTIGPITGVFRFVQAAPNNKT
jgi:methyltransferase (TIGR00027 family)